MTNTDRTFQLDVLRETHVGSPIGQLRAAPVRLGAGAPHAFLTAHCADFDIDPYVEMFFFPSDTLKLTLFLETGERLWQRDLDRAVVPGVWFCPVFPFDLDGGQVDEIWFHELVRGLPGQDGTVIDRQGCVLGSVGGPVGLLSKFLDHPGEQLLAYAADGALRVWGDRNAVDSPAALARYSNPLFAANQRLTAVGYNLVNLGGI